MKDYIIIILVFCFISCVRNYKSDNCIYSYSISIGDNIGIEKTEAEIAVYSVLRQSQISRYSIEIIIFSYSSGKEVYSYSEDTPDDIIIKTHSGRIEALVKIKIDNDLKEVFFLKAIGNDKKEILERLALELRKVLCD